MSASALEKAVKGGTKVKLAAPKSKYVETLVAATHSGEAGVNEVFRTLTHRLREPTWTTAFKALILVHLMIKEGTQDVTLAFVSAAPRNRLAINTFTDVQTQGHNIRRYSEYLLARAQAYSAGRCDYVRAGGARVQRLTVDKGLLRETGLVQDQVKALIRCDLFGADVENEISLTAFRLLTRDLLDLYQVENEAVMNVLSHYFEMSKPDAERAIRIYKRFCTQTDQVVEYLNLARQYEHATRLEIPKIKHAPTSLANSLQEYLDDKDFDVNRRQYMAEQEAKKKGKPMPKREAANSQAAQAAPAQNAGASAAAAPPQPAQVMASQPTKGPAPDLIDFFESIDQQQQPMEQNNPFHPQQQQQQQTPFGFAQPQQPQQTGFPQGFQQAPQQNPQAFGGDGTNPFGQAQQRPQQMPLQSQFTGFGGFGPQPQQHELQQQQQQQQQNGFASPFQPQPTGQMQQPQQQMQPQATNPFRQSMMPTGSGSPDPTSQRQSTNPFARSSSVPPVPGNAFAAQASAAQQQPPPVPQLQPQRTGTNPFARPATASTPPVPQLQVQPTGSTNPFRQSVFVNQQTGQGWQNGPQGTVGGGGLDAFGTVEVFPRPGQGPSQQQTGAMGQMGTQQTGFMGQMGTQQTGAMGQMGQMGGQQQGWPQEQQPQQPQQGFW